MTTTLKDNQNADYIDAYEDLKPKGVAKTVLVYVESYEDRVFWSEILNQYESSKIKFDIQLPSYISLAQGKSKALERHNDLLTLGVGKYLIICIDSDYDYLLQDKNPQSQLVNQSKYIFHTYSYSIENLICYSDGLNRVCRQATTQNNDRIDFNELLKIYSNIIYPLFLWSVYLKSIDDSDTMNLTEFCNTIKLEGSVNIHEQGKPHLEKLKTRVKGKVSKLTTDFPHHIEDIEILKTKLTLLGLNIDNAYLFIQGHTLQDGFVLPFLKSLSKVLRSEIESNIMSKALHIDQKQNDLKHYQNSIRDIETVLALNTEYKSCFLYDKIKADLDEYMAAIDI
jgi:hypothetical protein